MSNTEEPEMGRLGPEERARTWGGQAAAVTCRKTACQGPSAGSPWIPRGLAGLAFLGLLAVAGPAGAEFRLTDQTSEVYYRGFALVAGEEILIVGPTEIEGDLHSNGGVRLLSGSRVTGNVSAGKGVRLIRSTVSGEVKQGVEPLSLPVLEEEATFRALADRVVEGDLELVDAVVDEVLLVLGSVRIRGNLNGDGTIIATKDIRFAGRAPVGKAVGAMKGGRAGRTKRTTKGKKGRREMRRRKTTRRTTVALLRPWSWRSELAFPSSPSGISESTRAVPSGAVSTPAGTCDWRRTCSSRG